MFGVQKRNDCTLSVPDAEITRGTHAAIGVPRVLEIAHALRILFHTATCYRRASVGGSVINEKQFPIDVGLRENALNRFSQEALGIPKNDHDGDERLITHSS